MLSGLKPFVLLGGQLAYLEAALAGLTTIALEGKGANKTKEGIWTFWTNSRVVEQ